MNLWILNHYATPDSFSTRHFDLGKQLVNKGHKVIIFASSFTHYKFIEQRLQNGEKWRFEDYDKLRFVWIRTTPYRGNDWWRIINMLSYAWNVVWIGKRFQEKPDVIIGSCVHPFAVLSAYVLSRIKRSRFFFEVRDLWPQTIIDMGVLSEKNPVTWALRLMEKFLYKKAEKIITLLPYADKYITRLGIPKEKIICIPNGVDISRYENIKNYDGGKSIPFIIMYLGAHGKNNGLDIILKAANILQVKGMHNVRFIFVGDGPEKRALIEYATNLNLRNVEFCDHVPKKEIFKVMGGSDAFIFNLNDIPVLKYGISLNKIFDYLASGRPILFPLISANNPVLEAKAGIGFQISNPESLTKAVIELLNLSPTERIQMGLSGLEYVRKYHDIRLLANKLEEALIQSSSG